MESLKLLLYTNEHWKRRQEGKIRYPSFIDLFMEGRKILRNVSFKKFKKLKKRKLHKKYSFFGNNIFIYFRTAFHLILKYFKEYLNYFFFISVSMTQKNIWTKSPRNFVLGTNCLYYNKNLIKIKPFGFQTFALKIYKVKINKWIKIESIEKIKFAKSSRVVDS